MRNLKKILALVLALVMSMSLLATANAFEDEKDIDGKFNEAVTVLNALKVFQGYDDGKTFRPQGEITRAEVAAIIYRIVTGDTADKQVKIYKDYNKFDDVKSDKWYAGYVNFCANAEIIKGYSDTKFGPNDTVTGYQALAMILRAIGYDKNGEFTGAGWQVQTAAVAKKLNVTKNITAGTLGTAATREMVAEILFRTIAYAKQVDYTLAFGYSDWNNETLGEETFGLYSGERVTLDKWGRPGYSWFASKVKSGALCTFKESPLVSYTTAVKECDLASTLGLDETTSIPAYINGLNAKGLANAKVTVEPTDVINSVGAQGRLTEVYADRIVMIDTYLAEVDDVAAARYDAAGHLYKQASMTLKVYDAKNVATTVTVYADSDYSYVKGDYVLVNSYTQAYNSAKIATKAVTDKVNTFVYADILGLAENMTGAQTNVWMNAAQHTVDGTTYDDANTYYKDAAGNTPFVPFTWFFDNNGNLIGSAIIAEQYTYGILKNIIWNVGTPGYATATIIDAATGEESVVNVNKIDGDAADAFNWDTLAAAPMYSVATQNYKFMTVDATNYAYVGNDSVLNNNYLGYALYRVQTLSTGAVNLIGKVDDTTIVNYAEDVTITKGGTWFNGAGLATVNDNTVFTIRTGSEAAGYTYTQYVGKENVPTYNDAEVFYTDKNGDGFVDYVYIKNGTADNRANNFVLATSNTYYNHLYNNAQVYGVYQALVNGEAIADPLLTTVLKNVTDLFFPENGHFQPYYVTYDAAGYIDEVKPFTKSSQTAGNEWYLKLNVTACDGTTLVHDNATTAAGRYNITSAAVYGDYTKEQIADVRWNEVDVYAVYTKVGVAPNEFRVVTQLYIMDKGMGGNTPEGPTAGEKTTITYEVNFYDSNKSTILDTVKKAFEVPAATYVYGGESTATGNQYSADGILALFGADAAAWTASYCTPFVTVTEGNNSDVVLNVYPTASAPVVNP